MVCFSIVLSCLLAEPIFPGTKVSSKDNIIKYSVLGVTTLITFWAVWYIYSKMGKVKVQVIHQRRKARCVSLMHIVIATHMHTDKAK